MKRNTILISILFFSVQLQAQYFDWGFSLGSADFDYGRGLVTDDQGNVYVTGMFYDSVDFDPGPTEAFLVPAGPSEVFLAKYDGAGNYIWAKSFSPISNANITDIGMDLNGNIYVTGATLILKFDTNGTLLWQIDFGAALIFSQGNALDSDGNIYITGNFVDLVDFDPGSGTSNLSTTSFSTDIFLAKYDPSGSYLWAIHLPGTFSDVGNEVAVDANDNVYITGYIQRTVDFNPGGGVANLTPNGSYDGFLAKYDQNGNYQWAFALGEPASITQPQDLEVRSGSIYLTGYFSGTTDFDPGTGTLNLTSPVGDDVFIANYDLNGGLRWAKSLTGTNNYRAKAMTFDEKDNIYITGEFSDTVDVDPDTGVVNLFALNAFQDVFMAKYDSLGNYIWATSIKGGNLDYAYGIAVDTNENIFTIGTYKGTADLDPSPITETNVTSNGNEDVFVVKISLCTGSSYTLGGVVSDEEGVVLEQGNVLLFDISASSGGFDTLNIVPINSNGTYAFSGFYDCEFFAVAIPDSAIYPNLIPTYLGSVPIWTDADTFYAINGIAPDTIKCNQVTPQTGSGTNSIRGYVISNLTGKRAEPIEDEDIILNETPPGLPRAYTHTDNTGYFEFNNLDDGRYELFVEIAGIPMDISTNVINFSGGNSNTEVTAYVDSNIVTIALGAPSGIDDNKDAKFSIAPNPSDDRFQITFEGISNERGEIKVFNVLGEAIYSEQILITPGYFNMEIDLSKENKGIYFFHLQHGKVSSVEKVMLN